MYRFPTFGNQTRNETPFVGLVEETAGDLGKANPARFSLIANVVKRWGCGTAATAPALQAGLSRVRVPSLPPICLYNCNG